MLLSNTFISLLFHCCTQGGPLTSRSFRPTVPILWVLLLVPRCSAGGSKEPFVCCHGIAVNYSAGPLVCSSLSQHQRSLSRTSKMARPCLKSLSHFPLVFLGLSYGLSNTLLSRLHSCASTFFFSPCPSFSLRLPFFLCVHSLLWKKIETQVCTHMPCSGWLSWCGTGTHKLLITASSDAQHRPVPQIKQILCTTPLFPKEKLPLRL